MIKNVWAVYFSPAGHTEKVIRIMAEAAAERLEINQIKTMDFTLPGQRKEDLVFTEEDLVFLGSPTYAGRIPNKLVYFIKDHIKGNGAMGAALVTFGNRSYDNSLMEMYTIMKRNGFSILGGAAFVCQHVFSEKLAFGRPKATDQKEIAAFGRAVGEKALKGEKNFVSRIPGDKALDHYYTPLGEDGRPAVFLKAKPKVNMEKCEKCGYCVANCPMGSISEEDPAQVSGICIKCQSCVLKCPKSARYFDDPAFLSHCKMLENTYADKEAANESYL